MRINGIGDIANDNSAIKHYLLHVQWQIPKTEEGTRDKLNEKHTQQIEEK